MKFLFISEILPIDTYASEAVFFRHFKQLADEGHEIHILTDSNSYQNRKKELPDIFFVHLLPNRKWYYPPFKPYGLLQKIRFTDYYLLHVKPLLSRYNFDKIIGFVHGNFLPAFTAFVTKKSKLPLISFFHDDTLELSFGKDIKSMRKNTAKILDASVKVLVASTAFELNWQNFAHKFVLLYPIPAKQGVRNKLEVSENVHIGYAGSVYNEIIPYLEQIAGHLTSINATLTIIGNNGKANFLQKKYNKISSLPLFETAEAANEYLLSNTNVGIIAYPSKIDEMPWISTCFPSKFIQYCTIGLPTLVIAPPDSAMGKWCLQENWLLYSDKYDFTKIKHLLHEVLNQKEVSQQVEFYQQNVFNVEIIHQQFKKELFN